MGGWVQLGECGGWRAGRSRPARHAPPPPCSAQVDDEPSWRSQLVRIIKQDPGYESGSAKMLVFARDTAAADQTSELLQSAGIE